ncbi:MAG TPA: IS110 family transposase [Steroidobacteraceae bacterium]
MKEITTVSVDLAKDLIVACTADACGRVMFFKQFGFRGFAEWAANLPPCMMAMEACSSAHFWARTLAALGHRPKLLAPDLVAPFRKSKGAKNDRNDAEAILIAALQPNMRFVSVKSIEQQSILACHRMREGWKVERTALINRLRGVLAEFGVWIGRSAQNLARSLPKLTQDEQLPARVRTLLAQAQEHLRQLESLMEQGERDIAEHARHSEAAQRLSALNGIGPITASAIVASVGDARDFRNGRQMAAWAGLVPKQSSSGGKDRLGKITKRGDTYLRGLLTQGARSTLNAALGRAPDKRSRLEHWIVALRQRAGYHKALVAIANKHARICWAMLAREESYDPNGWQRHAPIAA